MYDAENIFSIDVDDLEIVDRIPSVPFPLTAEWWEWIHRTADAMLEARKQGGDDE